jgi:hypothetical protein
MNSNYRTFDNFKEQDRRDLFEAAAVSLGANAHRGWFPRRRQRRLSGLFAPAQHPAILTGSIAGPADMIRQKRS